VTAGEVARRCLSGALPEGAVLVRSRILRRVFRVDWPGSGEAYVKQHLFPFLRVRLRYALRRGPASREARLLARAAARGLKVPEVLAVRERRGLLGPRLSVLVTKSLEGRPIPGGRESWDFRFRAVERLIEAGLDHRDLHPDNLFATEEGEPAFLDLQSCRFPGPRRAAGRRLEMLAPLFEPDLEALRTPEGKAFLAARGLPAGEVLDRIVRLRSRRLRARRRHALRPSSHVERRWKGPALLLLRRGRKPPEGRFERIRSELRWRGRPLVLERSGGERGCLRLRGRACLRDLWLRALLEPGPGEERIFAWERKFPWPWAEQSLYISAAMGGPEDEVFLLRLLAGSSDFMSAGLVHGD